MYIVTSYLKWDNSCVGTKEFRSFAEANGFFEIVSKISTWSVTFDYVEKVA